MDIRRVNKDDASAFAILLKTLDNETKYMMYEPGERIITSDMMCARIEGMLNSGSMIYGAFEDNNMLGFVMLMRGGARRTCHSGYLVIGVIIDARGKGIGTELMKAIEQWALDNDVIRLELTVMTENKNAYQLYLNRGFNNEGIKKNSLLVDGKYVDEYYMGKTLKDI